MQASSARYHYAAFSSPQNMAGQASESSRSLSYAKEVQGERNGTCSALPGRSLSYAKKVQGERNGACSALPKYRANEGRAKLLTQADAWAMPSAADTQRS